MSNHTPQRNTPHCPKCQEWYTKANDLLKEKRACIDWGFIKPVMTDEEATSIRKECAKARVIATLGVRKTNEQEQEVHLLQRDLTRAKNLSEHYRLRLEKTHDRLIKLVTDLLEAERVCHGSWYWVADTDIHDILESAGFGKESRNWDKP